MPVLSAQLFLSLLICLQMVAGGLVRLWVIEQQKLIREEAS